MNRRLYLTVTALVLLAAVLGLTEASTVVYPCPIFGIARLPHAWSCGRFVQCVNGEALVQECTAGAHYNPDTEQCMDPWYANCRVEQSPCPKWSDPQDLWYLSHGTQCDKYFMCYNNEPREFSCAYGFVWNATVNKCEPSVSGTCPQV